MGHSEFDPAYKPGWNTAVACSKTMPFRPQRPCSSRSPIVSSWRPARSSCRAGQTTGLRGRVQGVEARRMRQWRHEGALGIFYQTLDLPLVVAFAGAAKPGPEQVMADQLGEGARPRPPPVAKDPCHCQYGIVIQDRQGHAPEKETWPSQKRLPRLRGASLDERRIRMWQVHAEHMYHVRTPPMKPMHWAKSTCA